MPTPEQITESLTRVANHFTALALGWHLALVVALVFALAGWRPGKRTAALLIILPAWSVASLAWYQRNPFNGAMFVLLAVMLTNIAFRLPRQTVRMGSRVDRIAGAALIVFGFVYPHFVETTSWLAYVYESPFGLVPCPTLAIMTGVSLLANGFDDRRWMWCLSVATALYGAIGVGTLAVWIDAALLGGAPVLAYQAWREGNDAVPGTVGDFSRARVIDR